MLGVSFRSIFWGIFLIGLGLRLYLAFFSTAMHWPDEQFQTLEPASRVVHGYGLMSWEWQEGYRSWITPAFFMPLLWVAKLFGATGGLEPILLSRAMMAALSMLVVIGLDRLAKRFEISETTRLLFASAYALSVPMILWAPATLSDTLVTNVWWFVLPFALVALAERRAFFAGLLLGLPILFRPQMGVLGIGIGLALLAFRAYRPLSLQVAAGGLVSVGIYGFVDWIFLGLPFGSLYRQLTEGLKKSEFYGVSPWWDYFPRTVADQGTFWLIAIGFLVVAGVLFSRRVSEKNPLLRPEIAFVVVPIALYFAVHSGIKHKETRFIQVVFPLFFFLGAGGLDSLLQFARRKWPPLEKSLRQYGGTLILASTILLVPAVSQHVLDARLYLSSVDTAVLFHRIYVEEKRAPATPLAKQCVLLIDNNWSFTRGSLGMGRQYAGVDRNLAELKPQDFRECGWVIARPESEPGFRSVSMAAGRDLIQIVRSTSGFALYR